MCRGQKAPRITSIVTACVVSACQPCGYDDNLFIINNMNAVRRVICNQVVSQGNAYMGWREKSFICRSVKR